MATGLQLGVNACGRLVLFLPIPYKRLPIFADPSVRRTFWQRIGQPYVRKSGRCFVAVVEIETDSCTVCLVELDAVQSEADIQADVCARRLSGRVGGQATNSLPTR